MYDQILTNIGLNPEQAKIYLSLLDKGPQTASNLAQNTKIKRTYIYAVTKSLIKLGLATQELKAKTTYFKATSPDLLLSLAEAKKKEINQTYLSLENLLPTLSSQFILSGSRPIITYHEGIEGIKHIYQDTLKEGATIYAFLQNAHIDPTLRSWLKGHYLPSRVEKGIHASVIISSGELSKQYLLESHTNLRTTLEVPAEKFPFQHEVNIYGSKVAFMNFHSDQMLGFIINHPQIAQTMQAWFQLTWTSLQVDHKATVILQPESTNKS